MSRDLSRIKGTKKDASLVVVASEGELTEPNYFNHLKDLLLSKKVHIESIPCKNGKSAPKYILENLAIFRKKYQIGEGDALWLVIDYDSLDDKKLTTIADTAKGKGYSLAVSRPCFEFWLLLHFYEWDAQSHKFHNTDHTFHCKDELNFRRTCARSTKMAQGMKMTIPKSARDNASSYTIPIIKLAISRANTIDIGSGEWPTECPGTKVHKLLSLIFEKAGEC